MNDSVSQANSGDPQRAWIAGLVALSGGAANGSPTAAAPATAGSGSAPNATAADLFFDKDSPALTPSDQKSLDDYAAAYIVAGRSEPVTVDAWASSEGESAHNKKLANDRAKAVADYLGKKGIPGQQIKAAGHGPTEQFSKTDPAQNRRATLKPPPPAAPAGAAAASGKMSLKMRDEPPKSPLDATATLEKIAGKDQGIPRDKVEKELTSFLHDLADSQKTKSVKGAGTAWAAEATLREGLPGEPVLKQTDDKSYDPDELAHKIAASLPDTTPAQNFNKFHAMKAEQLPDKGSLTDQIHRKYVEERDAIIKKLPEKAQGLAKKAMDAAIEKGVPFVADSALKALGVTTDLESEMKKAVESYSKTVTANKDDDDK